MISDEWWNSLVSFLLGAASVSLLWCWQQWQQQLPDELDNVSWIDPWNATENLKVYWTNRIGELPIPKRTHWPWETIRMFRNDRKHSRSEGVDDKDEQDEVLRVVNIITGDDSDELSVDTNEEDEEEDISKICIGSIFGLDVGGTLSKLVYFEQKAMEHDPCSLKKPELRRHYSIAASAKAVTTTSRGEENVARPSTLKRRSFSVDCMRRPQTDEEEKKHQEEANPFGNLRSKSSEIELRTLNDLRQESVPGDLDQYRTSVQFSPLATPHHKEEQQKEEGEDSNDGEETKIGKSKSMLDLSQSQKKAEALDRFYNFARRLDSYQDSLRDHNLSFYSRELGGEFHFIRFETRWMKNAMDFIRYNHLHLNIAQMGATGGGAHKYADMWERDLGIKMDKQEELDSLVAGMQFVLTTVVGECYTFRPNTRRLPKKPSQTSQVGATLNCSHSDDSCNQSDVNTGSEEEEEEEEEEEDDEDDNGGKERVDEWWWSRKVQRDAISYSSAYPYMLVTIGTGVSILRVDGPRQHERISGSTIGGGTYWGLIRLLTDVEDFEDVMRLAEKGDPSKVDMMVGDIYGKNSDALEKLGLPAHIVASSFGKLVAKQNPAHGLKQEDLARALLLMVTNNIGQVAYLNAKLHKTPRIYFVGNFLRRNMISQRRLSYAINYWSKGEMEALFLEHEGYFGALGAFLTSQNIPHEH